MDEKIRKKIEKEHEVDWKKIKDDYKKGLVDELKKRSIKETNQELSNLDDLQKKELIKLDERYNDKLNKIEKESPKNKELYAHSREELDKMYKHRKSIIEGIQGVKNSIKFSLHDFLSKH